MMDIKELACSVERWANDHKEEMVRDIIKIVNQKSVSDPGEGGYAFGTTDTVKNAGMLWPEWDRTRVLSLIMTTITH